MTFCYLELSIACTLRSKQFTGIKTKVEQQFVISSIFVQLHYALCAQQKKLKMNKTFGLIILSIVILGTYANPEPPRFARKQLRPLPARFTSRLFSRQEQSPTDTDNKQGYNYPKPDYGLPEQQPPTTEEAEFTTEAEAEAIEVSPDNSQTVDENQVAVDLLKEALKNRRIVYIGVPERQIQFEELVYYPTSRATLVEYQPYTAIDTEVDSIDVIQFPQPAYAYSSQYFEQFFKKK